jgi:hypothetical protein
MGRSIGSGKSFPLHQLGLGRLTYPGAEQHSFELPKYLKWEVRARWIWVKKIKPSWDVRDVPRGDYLYVVVYPYRPGIHLWNLQITIYLFPTTTTITITKTILIPCRNHLLHLSSWNSVRNRYRLYGLRSELFIIILPNRLLPPPQLWTRWISYLDLHDNWPLNHSKTSRTLGISN